MSEHVLIVEKQEGLRGLYQTELEKEGYDVVAVANGHDALDKLAKEPLDLVVLELLLPDGFGLDYLQEFINIKRDLKVVINTSHPEYKMDFRSWAAEAFLVKSLDVNDLKNTIDRVLHS